MIKKLVLVMLMVFSAQAAYATDLVAKNAWVRLVPSVAQNTAAYMLVRNVGADDVKLIGVTCDVAASADLHGMRMDDNRMVMFPLQEVNVPAGGEVAFAPGGMHMMLMGLKHSLKEGDVIEIVLHVSNGESLAVSAPVRDMRMGQHRQGGMH